jgi:energy-coupling factor transport system permease protein
MNIPSGMTKFPTGVARRRPTIRRHLTLGQYFAGQSGLHQLDARTKLVASIIVMALLMWLKSWPVLIFWSLALAVLVQRSKLPPRLFIRNLRAFIWLFAITILLHALNPAFDETPGLTDVGTSPQLRMWGISISWTGLQIGLKYALRLVLLIIVTGILSFTTVPTDLTDGVERLLKPLQRWRVPVHELAFMTTLALRFVPTIMDEAERIQKAQMSRGADFSGSLLKRIQSLVPLLVPLFVATFHRADELAIAMEARCYRGSEGRVSFREMNLARRDFGMMASVLLCAGMTLVFEKWSLLN